MSEAKFFGRRAAMRSMMAAAVAGGAAIAGRKAPRARAATPTALDARVHAFLDRRRGEWHDLNVPYDDGRALHDLIVKKRFTRGLEIGTSTGHSGIWIAWALAKAGDKNGDKNAGKLTTIEIDPNRHRAALANFEAAGVAPFVDARLGDAHQLVKQLKGPFDFVFSDADKDWYTQYFLDAAPKVPVGGCFTAHNVLDGFAGIDDFMRMVRARADFTTTIVRTSPSGLSVSCRTR